jgi:DNA-binding LacI/PurR family transcriptional regulator
VLVNSKEIAARAGVSQATVSRVINERSNVRDDTRRRVWAVIEELGYVPDASARGLVTQRTTRIGLIISDILNPFYPELVESVEEAARESGYTVLLCNTQRDPANDQVYARFLIEQRVAGVLFASVTMHSQAPQQLAQAEIPCVFMNRTRRDLCMPSVLTDNVGGAYKMTEHLIHLGHRRIAFVRGMPDTTTSQDRELGFCRCLIDHRLSVEAALLEQGDYTRSGAYRATVRLLLQSSPPTAIFCANDYMAFGALEAAADLGICVPEQVSIVGFDNIALSSLRAIALTTVEQPIAEMAKRATEILLHLIAGEAAGTGSRGYSGRRFASLDALWELQDMRSLGKGLQSEPWIELYEPRLVVRSTSAKPAPIGAGKEV